eukprot:TRINITY_DN12413_c0_g1_i1.p1 TRINITY_DN12413_c0_g1~~TRINITY_DN12413_c0_g1_i1.p1  ORF type:complete len:225 (+),score=26.46 TRINITY_DN12413_c0_g1_i1:70-744(+)
MTIIYSLVANGPTVLAEYSPNSGNFTGIARQLLREVPIHKHKKSYAAQNTIFHYMVDDNGLVFLCMADSESGHRVPFSFLEDVRTIFVSQLRNSYKSAGELGLNDVFSRTLKDRMHFFNTDPEADKYRKIMGDIEIVKDQMIGNIDKVIERGGKIEQLQENAQRLETKSFTFKQESRAMVKRLWWKNVKLWFCIAILLILIVGVLVFIALWYLGIPQKMFKSSE